MGIAILSSLAFATMAIFAKLGYEKGAEALPLLAGRFTLAALLLFAYGVATRSELAVGRSKIVKLLLLGAFGYAVEASLFFAALERAPASIVGLIFYTYPLWTALLGLATRLQPWTPRIPIALGLATAGIVTIFTIPTEGSAGLLLALAAAVAVALYFTAVDFTLRGIDAFAGAVWTTAGAAASLLVVAFATSQHLPLAAAPEVIGLGVASAVAFVLLFKAIVVLGSTRVSIAMMVEPIATLLMAAVILDEPLSSRIAIGAALVVAALPVIAGAKTTAHPEAP
ncbi:MAG TPA: DMT family transporter [Actinomycetota bacterium]|nr:DMT family transporter [Actinomycetota bacterium]